jgi:hypothetical protein
VKCYVKPTTEQKEISKENESKIDELAYKLYDITNEEIRIIENG